MYTKHRQLHKAWREEEGKGKKEKEKEEEDVVVEKENMWSIDIIYLPCLPLTLAWATCMVYHHVFRLR